ncbi:MAG TPA: NAD-binding protein, partial [Alphaproteobacteria bacterium]|nr:NAD-binding protein [Alphaproteobacteria bacterium]
NGHAMKAVNNIIAGTSMIAVAEGLAVGEEFGLDPKTIIDVLNASTGRGFVTEFVAKEHVITGKYQTGFALGLLAKDVRIAADLSEDVKLDAPLFRLVRERFAMARDKEGAAADSARAFAAVKEFAKKPRKEH